MAVDVPIRLSAGPFSGRSARLTNVSVSGGCIKSSFDLRLLSRIELAIELPRRFTPATSPLVAYVTRKLKSGAGIEWCEFAPPAISELIRSATPRRYGYPRRSVTPARAQPQPRAPAHAPEPPHGPESPLGAEETRAAQPLSPPPQALLKHGT